MSLNLNQLPTCPITCEIMKDPVTTPCGNTYERVAIEEWLSRNCAEPLTKQFLTKDKLIPNRALKDMYDNYMANINKNNESDNLVLDFESMRNPLKLEVTEIKNINNNRDLLITINSPEITNESDEDFHDIVLCLDVSGSMGSSADTKGIENTGLSILDILKHGVKTIINTCTSKNRIGIVTFSSEGLIRCPLTTVNESGKNQLNQILEIINPEGMTNLYDGIIKSWSLIESRDRKNIKSTIIVFTDGEPNQDPPRGYIPQLKLIKEKNKGKYQCDINIYTFGNSVNSQLSNQISKETGGTYGYMPDASFIGDLLVHKLAAIRSCRAKNSILKIDIDGIKSFNINDSIEYVMTSNTSIQISVGDILYGQNKNYVLTYETENNKPNIFVSLEYNEDNSDDPITIENENVIELNDTNNSIYDNIIYNKIRQDFVSIVSMIINYCDCNDFISANNTFINFKINPNSDTRLDKMQEDLNGQIKMAFSSQYYGKWGRHYLLSILRAYQLELCNNFKDQGIQHFSSKLFEKIIDHADDIFTKMPPPKPSINIVAVPVNNNRGFGQLINQPAPQSAPISMATFNSRFNNSCFHGESIIIMGDNTKKKVSEIKKGDILMLANGKTDLVECIIKTTFDQNYENLVKINNELSITPYHPVRINNIWIFPKDLSIEKSDIYCDSIYSIVLTNRGMGNGVIIGNIECATLGHGIINDDVIYHPFFGSEKVIQNLKLSDNYINGLVILKENSLIRDPDTNIIIKINI